MHFIQCATISLRIEMKFLTIICIALCVEFSVQHPYGASGSHQTPINTHEPANTHFVIGTESQLDEDLNRVFSNIPKNGPNNGFGSGSFGSAGSFASAGSYGNSANHGSGGPIVFPKDNDHQGGSGSYGSKPVQHNLNQGHEVSSQGNSFNQQGFGLSQGSYGQGNGGGVATGGSFGNNQGSIKPQSYDHNHGNGGGFTSGGSFGSNGQNQGNSGSFGSGGHNHGNVGQPCQSCLGPVGNGPISGHGSGGVVTNGHGQSGGHGKAVINKVKEIKHKVIGGFIGIIGGGHSGSSGAGSGHQGQGGFSHGQGGFSAGGNQGGQGSYGNNGQNYNPGSSGHHGSNQPGNLGQGSYSNNNQGNLGFGNVPINLNNGGSSSNSFATASAHSFSGSNGSNSVATANAGSYSNAGGPSYG